MEIDGTDIPDGWALTPADLVLVTAKNEANRVDFALLLLFYASTRVRAAECVMNQATKAIEIEDIEARVAELERAAEQKR